MENLNVTIEWFLNPYHLQMISWIQTEAYKNAGLQVTLNEPKDHYDGFDGLSKETVDLHSNEPLHLFEHYSPELRALGTFFETDGGVMIRQSSMEKLKSNQAIKICTPVSEPETNKMGFEILKRYAKKEGFSLDEKNVSFVSMGFQHVSNIINNPDIDGAWLCFYNFEGIEAKQLGLEFTFIDQHKSPYINFSALEFITTKSILDKKKTAIDKFLAITSDMVTLCQKDPALAKSIYYSYTKSEPSTLMDAIITDTLPRLVSPIKADPKRWQALREMLSEMQIATLSDTEYATLWY